jgi:DNA-binding transcriptional regulator YhcF (GntR family)
MLSGVASALEQNYVDTLPENARIGGLDSLSFDWRLHKKQHRYIEIVNNMLKRIGHNEFAGQSKLPPVSGLAKEYGVSVHTAGLACIRLAELGIISATRHGRFVFTPGKNSAAGIRGANPLVKCEIKRFIGCCGFTLAAEGFAAILFETLDSEKRKTTRYNILTLYDYVQLFVDFSEKTGRGGFALTIGNELLDVMAWEFYFLVNWPQRYEAVGCHIEKSSKALAKYNKKTFFSEIARANKAMLDMTEELAGDIISI